MTELSVAPTSELQPILEPVVEQSETIDANAGRLATLHTLFRDMADTDGLCDETEQYLIEGGSVRLLLCEIRKLSDPSEPDQAIAVARDRFMSHFLPRSPLVARDMHNWALTTAEELYIDTMINKIDAHLEAQTPDEILALQQMPTLVRKTSFEDGKDIDLETLAGNHLYIIIDTLLKEHILRKEAIDEYRQESLVARMAGNRVLRLVLGGLTFGAAVAAHMHVLPAKNEILAEDVELTLKCLAGGMLLFEMPELVRHATSVRRQKSKRHKLHHQLAEGYEMSDLAMQIACSKPRYGNKEHTGVVTNRGGTHDKGLNLHRFRHLDEEFEHMNNDPGGRPYTGDQALAYAARLLIEHRDMVDAIIEPGLSANQRRERYLGLARVLAKEDIIRMKKNQTPHHLREVVLDVVLAAPLAVSPETAAALSDAKTLGRDASHFHLREQEETPEI